MDDLYSIMSNLFISEKIIISDKDKVLFVDKEVIILRCLNEFENTFAKSFLPNAQGHFLRRNKKETTSARNEGFVSNERINSCDRALRQPSSWECFTYSVALFVKWKWKH